MADTVYYKCLVTPTEECDEGYDHIQSDIAKKLGTSNSLDISGTYRYYYNSAESVTTDQSQDLIDNGEECCDGTVIVAADDEISFLYIKNTGSTYAIGLDTQGGTLASFSGFITIPAGESIFLRLSAVNPADVHVRGNGGATTAEVVAIIDTSPGV